MTYSEWRAREHDRLEARVTQLCAAAGLECLSLQANGYRPDMLIIDGRWLLELKPILPGRDRVAWSELQIRSLLAFQHREPVFKVLLVWEDEGEVWCAPIKDALQRFGPPQLGPRGDYRLGTLRGWHPRLLIETVTERLVLREERFAQAFEFSLPERQLNLDGKEVPLQMVNKRTAESRLHVFGWLDHGSSMQPWQAGVLIHARLPSSCGAYARDQRRPYHGAACCREAADDTGHKALKALTALDAARKDPDGRFRSTARRFTPADGRFLDEHVAWLVPILRREQR